MMRKDNLLALRRRRFMVTTHSNHKFEVYLNLAPRMKLSGMDQLPHPVCKNSWGTYHMFTTDENYKIRQRTSQFFAAQMITQKWVQPRNAEHRLFAASSDLRDEKGNVLVTAYPVLRPDGQWSLMVINRDYDSAHDVRILFRDDSARTESEFVGPLEIVTFGKAQYQWHPARRNGYADPDGPPVSNTVNAGTGVTYTLPPASLNIICGRLAE